MSVSFGGFQPIQTDIFVFQFRMPIRQARYVYKDLFPPAHSETFFLLRNQPSAKTRNCFSVEKQKSIQMETAGKCSYILRLLEWSLRSNMKTMKTQPNPTSICKAKVLLTAYGSSLRMVVEIRGRLPSSSCSTVNFAVKNTLDMRGLKTTVSINLFRIVHKHQLLHLMFLKSCNL